MRFPPNSNFSDTLVVKYSGEDDCSNPYKKSLLKLKIYVLNLFFRHTCSQISRTFVDDCSNPNITKS